jgi:hypothetical protein
VSVISTVPFA